jgi:Undecaprenyl-phosphate galactose phosphotransferase WbaP
LNQTCSIQDQGVRVKTALIVLDDLNNIDELVEQFRVIFHRVILVKNKDGRYGLNGLEALDFSKVLGLQVKNNLLSPGSQLLKRIIDLLASFFGLLFLAPFFGLIALLIKLDSPGTVFYRQIRLGRKGRPFNLLKFRSMYQNADQILMDTLNKNPSLKNEWDTYQKLENDPRITRVGRFLRKFSLDELPQLWNVVMARMSLVGPRPVMVNQREMYGKAFEEYMLVMPGMTGLWQVSGRNETTFVQRAELDTEYIQCWSLWLDIYLLVKTVKIVFWHTGAY